jgi:hypothetical protein
MAPSIAIGSTLSEDKKMVEAKYEEAVDAVNRLPELKKNEADKLELLTEKYKQFFYEINEERILFKLDSLLSGAALPVSTLTLTKPYPDSISVDIVDYSPLTYPLLELAAKSNDTLISKDQNGVEISNTKSNSKEVPQDAVAYTDVTIGFTATTYESALNFIKSIENMDKTIIVKNVNLKKGKDGAGLEGDILLTIYSVAKPNKLDAIELEFKPALPKGKANPFS